MWVARTTDGGVGKRELPGARIRRERGCYRHLRCIGGGPHDADADRHAGASDRHGDCDDADPTVHPGSPEVNDGQDNQCPGEPGHGQVDEVDGLIFVQDDTLCWPSQAAATGYLVARSGARSFDPCSDATGTSDTCATESAIPAPGQVFYYLVRAQTPWPGSWGAGRPSGERLLSCQ